jgi:hypothetical protein
MINGNKIWLSEKVMNNSKEVLTMVGNVEENSVHKASGEEK